MCWECFGDVLGMIKATTKHRVTTKNALQRKVRAMMNKTCYDAKIALRRTYRVTTTHKHATTNKSRYDEQNRVITKEIALQRKNVTTRK